MATSPGNSTTGASSRCTIRHLVDAVCKIRRQKQCATTARIHKAVRQQLQRNVEVEEVLEQLNAATSMGELWRVDNNGVTSYREPPKGTSKEHLKWSADKHARWSTKDQHSGQFMMGHAKYPQNEHMTQPANEHLTQRATEHLPWTVTDQLRCSTAEPLMEPSRCSMNEPFMWPMAEPVRWPTMNDPMSWSAAEPLRQSTVEPAQQQRSEAMSWPMNEPFRRPMNDTLAWQMNQSLRGPMAEQFAWHVTEPLRHPMADPLAWSVTEPLRRPMTEPLSWHGNDQLRRSITEPLGWPVAPPEPFRRPSAEHFNWCSPETLRQPAKETYTTKPVKDASQSTRNLNDFSSGWPARDDAPASHTSTKALSRSITNSQKDPFKETSVPPPFVCPTTQTMGTTCLPQHKSRTFSPSVSHTNSKFQSVPLPGTCKDMQNSCAELQRTCRDMPNICKDVQRLPDGSSQFGASQNPYHASLHPPHGDSAMMSSIGQGFCVPPEARFSCFNSCSNNAIAREPRSLGPNGTQMHHGNEIAPQIPAIIPVNKEHHCQNSGQLLEQCVRKSAMSGKCDGSRKTFRTEKCPPSSSMPSMVNSTAARMTDEVLEVARSLFDNAKPEKPATRLDTRSGEVESAVTSRGTVANVVEGHRSTFLQALDKPGCNLLLQSQCMSSQVKQPFLVVSSNTPEEQRPLCSSNNTVEAAGIALLSSDGDLGKSVSGNHLVPQLDLSAEKKDGTSTIQPLTSQVDGGVVGDQCQTSAERAPTEITDDLATSADNTATSKESEIGLREDSGGLWSSPETNVPHDSQDLKSTATSKCRRSLQNIRQPSQKKRLSSGNLAQLTTVILRFLKTKSDGKGTNTIRNIKNYILSKYNVSFHVLPFLARRIHWCCKKIVKTGLLQRKKHVYVLTSSIARKHQVAGGDHRIGSEFLENSSEDLPTLLDCHPDAARSTTSSSSSSSSSSLSTLPRALASLTGIGEELEMGHLAAAASCCLEDQDQPPSLLLESAVDRKEESEVVAMEAAASTRNIPGSISSSCEQSETHPDVEKSSHADRALEAGGDQLSENLEDVNPKGLIDGLTRFFTPSNKRSSRVSRNTLQRTLELKAKNRPSSKKTHVFSQVPQHQQQLLHTKSIIKAASTQNPLPPRLDCRDSQHRKMPSGRRREQLYDGLSHFFAVEGKRRSCTLGRLLGSDVAAAVSAGFSVRHNTSSLDSKSEFLAKGLNLDAENELLRLAGRVIRSRARSLSLSGTKDSKTPASALKKRLRGVGGGSNSLSRLNDCHRSAPPLTERRRSRTLSSSTHSSQQSTSTLDSCKSAEASRLLDCAVVIVGDALPGRLTMSTRLTNGRSPATSDATCSRISTVPSGLVKTTCCRPLASAEQHKLFSCRASTESLGTTGSCSLPVCNGSSSSSVITSFPNTGRSAMVKLTRLSSEDCSHLMLHNGVLHETSSDSVQNSQSLQVTQSPNSEGVDVRSTAAGGGGGGGDSDLTADDHLSTEQPTTLDTAEAHRVVNPGMTPNDMILFRKAQKIAAERILVSQELNNLDPSQPSPPRIQIGPYELTTTHSSLYPVEFARLPKLFICEFCLKYLKSQNALRVHVTKCRQVCPPGNELYRSDSLSVFEVNGDVSPVYCQNICLLARLFCGTKAPHQSSMSPYLFYVLTLNKGTGCHLVGYFAKEKYCLSTSSSLVGLLVLPQHQHQGYGDFLIQFSYLICRLNKSPGSPARPLSPVASVAFQSSWSKTIMDCIKTWWTSDQPLTIRDISLRTGIHPADISTTLSSLQLTDGTKSDVSVVLSLDAETVEKLTKQWVDPFINKRLRIDLKLLQWTKSSLQHLLKTSIDSEKSSQMVRRKSARKIQRKRKEDEFSYDPSCDAAADTKTQSENILFEEASSSTRSLKRKNVSLFAVSPSKNARLSSPDRLAAADVSPHDKLSSGGKTEALEKALPQPRSAEPEPESMIRSSSPTGRVIIKTPDERQDSNGGHSASVARVEDVDVGPSHPSGGREATMVDGSLTDPKALTGSVAQVPVYGMSEAVEVVFKNGVEKKSTRSVEVQTDAYESEYSDDDSDGSSEGSSTGDSSSCCSSSTDESEVEDAADDSQSSLPLNGKMSVDAGEAGAVVESTTRTDGVGSESLKSVGEEVLCGSSGGNSSASSEGVTSSQVVPQCESQGVENSLTPDSLVKSETHHTDDSVARSNSVDQNSPCRQIEGEESCSQQIFDSQDSCEQTTCNKTAFRSNLSHQMPEGATTHESLAQTSTHPSNKHLSKDTTHPVEKLDDSREESVGDPYSGMGAVGSEFQFSSTFTGSAPNIGMESPLSMNSSSEMGSCNVERTPSQVYSDCAQAQNMYGMESVGASPTCGYGINQSLTQMTSPTGSSQITSPVSNHSFNATRCSPAVGYRSTVDVASTPNAASQHPAPGTTFKMPTEDGRYAATSTAYPVNGFGVAMASPASLGQCGYAGQFVEQSPGGGQCGVVNQNSPNGLSYNMPTPSPTNSSSRSFNMASPNTNAYHGQPSVPHVYDRSCPSAPVLSYTRVLPQQLPSASDAVPWTHIYPPQATGYSLIKFSDQEIVPQHAVALPRNLLPAQPAVAVQQHLTQVNLVPLATKPAKCPTTAAPTPSKQHRRCGKSCKSSASSGLSVVRSQTVAPNVTIQPGTNMITSYNVINMNVDYRAQHPQIAAYPAAPYIANAAFINDAQQMQSLNIYQHRAISFPRQPQPHNNVYTATYGYINGAITQQSFNINVNSIMRQ